VTTSVGAQRGRGGNEGNEERQEAMRFVIGKWQMVIGNLPEGAA
jgi:hypothetical protein